MEREKPELAYLNGGRFLVAILPLLGTVFTLQAIGRIALLRYPHLPIEGGGPQPLA